MKALVFLPLMVLLSSGFCDLIHTYTFRQVGHARRNLFSECAATTPARLKTRAGDDDDANNTRWDKAVCKGAQLLADMAGDEKRAGNSFKPPRQNGESDFQDYSKSLRLTITIPRPYTKSHP